MHDSISYCVAIYCLCHIAACDMASAASNINDDILTIPECCTDSIQCYSEENNGHLISVYKVWWQKDRISYWKEISLPNDHSNSELVIGHN